jgi:hypothetical protein
MIKVRDFPDLDHHAHLISEIDLLKINPDECYYPPRYFQLASRNWFPAGFFMEREGRAI